MRDLRRRSLSMQSAPFLHGELFADSDGLCDDRYGAYPHRFSQHETLKDTLPSKRGKIYADEAFRNLHPKLFIPSLETVQACLLLGQFLGGEGEYRTKHIYVGIARLHAEVIRLWEIPDDLPIVDREERRRTWLTVRINHQWSVEGRDCAV